MGLYGRTAEQELLSDLLAGARAGASGTLVLRGEAGIGKTALLDWLAAEAKSSAGEDPVRVLRVTGIEPEADIAFGGLVQLLWPVQERLASLPGPQAAALGAVLGSGEQRGSDRFLTGLAVLTLLAELAEDGLVLCLVDDAQWLDQATAEAMLFAARRLAAERVAMVFAARDGGFTAAGLPEQPLDRLQDVDARRLLAQAGVAPILHQQVLTASAGNPLALLEFAAARRQQAGHPVPLSVPDRVLAAFRARIAQLPERTRLLVLVAAAEGRGELPLVLEAAKLLGIGLGDLEQAELAELVHVMHGTLTFRHPLIASAAYQGAPLARRLAVHQALAEAADDPDCRARHLAAAATSPDESIAAELAAAAERARARTAYAAAARLFEHAARIAPEPDRQAELLAEAARQALVAGLAPLAVELADRAEARTGTAAVRVGLAPLRAAAAAEVDDHGHAAGLLLHRAAEASPDDAASLLRTAADQAWQAGDAGVVRDAARQLHALGADDSVATAWAALTEEKYDDALARLRRVLARGGDGREQPACPTLPPRLLVAAGALGDDEAALRVAEAELTRCREEALIGSLPQALEAWAEVLVVTGRYREAKAAVAEAEEIARDIGLRRRLARLATVRARIAAVQGDEDRALAAGLPGSEGPPHTAVLALLDLGLGRTEKVLERLEAVPAGWPQATLMPLAAAADQVEAAVRLGEPERAAEPLQRFSAWAHAAGTSWGRAVVLRCRALLAEVDALDNVDPDNLYAGALRLHEGSGRPFEQARTELAYGEWLRRSRRRSHAREPLRAALAVFEQLRAAPWAERARAELLATGEVLATAKPTADNLVDRLTPQELQVVRLAAAGQSSREIAAQLFLSRRTVEHHLYKAYPKLGVGSRRDLARLDLG
ncbi:transcriptional regulator, LuxR family [Kribbella flavida DSM 17836]|uniref:Transcriptional regulator, LuxR family n=1 Tax=Kribbella flavida (strain DSM 17836 / JCM 10339 / NBRC 14399) TaxID=479435 RepID=D2PZR4_KRIFD|nr:LuxR family transcriptional regulator [Kribbella flavida]ADB35630.1 transcriptional regulator, LuxR family [Kribbella flavida DSM 17836]